MSSNLIKETCFYERLRILWLHSSGLSLRAIARRSGRSPCTVRRWLRWWERCGRLHNPVRCERRHRTPVAAHGDGNLTPSLTEGNLCVTQKTLLYYWLNAVAMELLPYAFTSSSSLDPEIYYQSIYGTLARISLLRK